MWCEFGSGEERETVDGAEHLEGQSDIWIKEAMSLVEEN